MTETNAALMARIFQAKETGDPDSLAQTAAAAMEAGCAWSAVATAVNWFNPTSHQTLLAGRSCFPEEDLPGIVVFDARDPDRNHLAVAFIDLGEKELNLG